MKAAFCATPTADQISSDSLSGWGLGLITCCTGNGKWIILPSSPNWTPGRIIAFKKGQINEINLSSSGDNLASSIGTLSGAK